MRIILDTNVWISSLLRAESPANFLVRRWEAFQFGVVTSPYILNEIKRVLTYPKLQKRVQWDEKRIQQYLDRLSFFAETIYVDEIYAHVPSDTKDSPILSLLIKSEADFLISGDSDLLMLKDAYPILTIGECLQKLDNF